MPLVRSRIAIAIAALALPSLAAACHGANGDAQGSPSTLPAPGAPPVCGDVQLRVERTQSERRLAFASNATPTIVVDLTSAPDVDSTVLTARACRPGAPADTKTIPGANGFVVDAGLYANAAQTGCMMLTASAMKQGVVAASASAVVRFGDRSIHGWLQSPVAIDRVRLDVQIDDAHFPFDVVGDGSFTITHLPAGRLVRLSAAQRGDGARANLIGSVAPAVTLDDAHPDVAVTLPLRATPLALDAFEPDDALSQAKARKAPPLASGLTESHALPSRDDVDYVPLTVASGSTYRVKVSSLQTRQGDFAIVVVDGTGAVLAHVNDTPTSFSALPVVSFTAAADGVVFAKVTRNDDEPTLAAYSIALARVATAP